MTPRSQPSQAFNSSLQILLREGSQRVIPLHFPTKEEAIRYRSRLHRLRLAMRKENHPDWKMLYAACVRIDPSDPRTLIVEPQDYCFAKAIHEALGTEFKPLPVSELTITNGNPEEDLAKFFGSQPSEKNS